MEARILANYILMNYGPMSHLKLQKLLFYCEAYHLAYFERSLLDEDFEAWVHGPVCREVFNHFKGKSLIYSDLLFTGDARSAHAEFDAQKLSSTQLDFLSDVLGSLSSWTAFELENATHNEKPWMEARSGYGSADKCSVAISKESMKDFYKAELVG